MHLNRVKFFSPGWLVLIFLGSLSGNPWGHTFEVLAQTPPARAEEDSSQFSYLPLIRNDTPQPPASPKTIFGVEVGKTYNDSSLHQVKEANTSFIRLNGIFWADIETEQGERNWTALAEREKQMVNAAQNDMHVILVVRNTPPWAQQEPGVSCGPIRQDKLQAFGDFMYDLVTRYSKSPYYIKYWEIWNEPDVDPDLAMGFGTRVAFGCWGDPSDDYYGGGYYADMLKVVYPRIKEADPEAQVLVGGLLMSCNPAIGGCMNSRDELASKFFEGILVNQGGNYFDGVAFHNYDTHHLNALGRYSAYKWGSAWNTTGPALIAKAQFLRDLLETYKVSGKFLMNTETALLCGGNFSPPGEEGCEAEDRSVFERTKAYYVAQAYAAATAVGLKANVWYSLTGWRNSGLVYTDLSPRPAFTAFQISRMMLSDVSTGKALTSADTGGVEEILGFKFQHPDGRLTWVIWSKNARPQSIPVSTAPSGVWDSAGKPLTMTDPLTLEVTINPMYVVWLP